MAFIVVFIILLVVGVLGVVVYFSSINRNSNVRELLEPNIQKEEILDDLQAKKLSDSAQIVHMPESEKSS